jgi:carbon monoxide dehydrogenase subunit G
MKLENEFTVPAPLDHAWAVLLDVERVAPCLPGAQVEPGAGEDGEYVGTMTIKIGPITSRYKGTVKIERADVDARVAVMRAQAKDARGQGTAAATITSTMEEVADGTRVKVETDMRVTGPAAQFGRGVMQDVSAKLMRQFAECLASEMSAAPAETNGVVPIPEPEPVAAAPSNGGTPAPEPEPEAPQPERRAPEVLDLGEASREALLKRAIPIVGGVIALLVVIRLIRRR